MKKLVLPLLCCTVITTLAQQDPQFSQNTHNKLFTNPGVAGSNQKICFSMIARHQWVGFEGRPETYAISLHAPWELLHGGVGMVVFVDKLGQERTTNAHISYAFLQSIGNGLGELGLGVAAGIMNKHLGNAWRANDAPSTDSRIPHNGFSKTGFDLNFGAYYKAPQLWLGLSSTRLMAPRLQQTPENYQVARHYYVMAGYEVRVDRFLKLRPSVFAKTDAASAQVDVNVSALWNDLAWAGLSYRYRDAIVPMVGAYYHTMNGTFKVGYSYDITTSQLRNHSSGTHEIMVGYCFEKFRNPFEFFHKTVRWL